MCDESLKFIVVILKLMFWRDKFILPPTESQRIDYQVSLIKCIVLNLPNNIRVMRKTDFWLCKNKDADQLCSHCTADQRLCFRSTDM